MATEEIAILKHISSTLDKVYETISKPQSKVVQIFNIGAAVVGVLGILAIVDILRSWINSL
jgi:energy-converting hydrogenase Eha subunit F